MAYPTKLLNDGERVVISVRTHPKVLIGPLLIGLIILVAAVFLTRVGSGRVADISHIGLWVVAVVALIWFVVTSVVRWATTTYTFTNRRFIKRSGLVAKEGRTIPLNRISGVDFEIGVIDRLFGCGTLIVSDASTDGRVLLDDIPHVEQVQMQVAQELHRLSSGDRSDDGT